MTAPPPLKLDYRPRLADTRPLSDEGRGLESLERGPRVSPVDDFAGRTGYQSGFLGFEVPLPQTVDAATDDVLPVDGGGTRLDYEHFSIVMSKSRRMAIVVGCNINGASTVSIERGKDKWAYDGRIPIEAQIGEALYAGSGLDRGHLVRREDPNWGDANTAATANQDTFHFTNCSPQMGAFNQRSWLGLETYILSNTRRWGERTTVFTGPVFRDDDPVYRDVRIPVAYWKVVAFVHDDGRPSATAYLVDQSRELRALEAAFGRYKTYQRSIRSIEQATSLSFGALSQYDAFSNEEQATGTHIVLELDRLGEIRL
ncbi:DNA/RNA non-specific endonuclease [Azospirillum palustre]